jgi:hypothetical protein
MSETAARRHFIQGMTEVIIRESHAVAACFMDFAVDYMKAELGPAGNGTE